MKVLIASDLHGSNKWTSKLMNVFNEGDFDLFILLGDLYYHGPRNPLPDDYAPMKVCEKLNNVKNKLIVTKGNCDAEVDEMISEFPFQKQISLGVGEKLAFFSHGHNYNIDQLPNGNFDVMFYGHFHTPFIKQKNDKLFVNVGSVSLPKNDTPNSYCVLTEQNVTIFDFDGNVVEEHKF